MDTADHDSLLLTAKHELWRRGNLSFKHHSTQRLIAGAINKSKRRRHLLLCSRRLGKSFLLVCFALEQAIKNPGSRIIYAAPFAKDANDIANDIAVQILSDCPEDLRPTYMTQQKELRFSNGSVIRFAGLNAEHAQFLRGRAAHLFIIDEIGLVDDFKYVLTDVVNPTLMTTGGKLLMATTPARSPGHDSTTIANDMLDKGEVSTFTILDAPHVTNEVKAEYLEAAGEDPKEIPGILAGETQPKTTTALREYFCRLDVTDAETAVVPEFNSDARRDICKFVERPDYFDCYVSIDPGFNDKTGGLFGYWDFRSQKLVIEGEFLLPRANTDEIAQAVIQKERSLWGDHVPLVRICDIDHRLMSDLAQRHGLFFQKAQRADSLSAINFLRTMIQRREIIIHPSCILLIRQLQNATWNKKATDFERTEEDAHFDLVAALKYLCRAVIRGKNPYPEWLARQPFGTFSSGQSKKGGTVFSDTPLGRKFKKKWG